MHPLRVSVLRIKNGFTKHPELVSPIKKPPGTTAVLNTASSRTGFITQIHKMILWLLSAHLYYRRLGFHLFWQVNGQHPICKDSINGSCVGLTNGKTSAEFAVTDFFL